MEPQPKQRDADRSRAAILDAAERLFAADGFEAVTMAQIGAAAGVSRGTPGYFFGSKDALYRVVVQRASATLRMLAQTLRVRDATGSRADETLIADTVAAFLTLLTSRRSIVALIDQSAGGPDGDAHALAVRDALDGLGTGADRVAMHVLALCWFPLSNPAAARALGIDVDGGDFVASWSAHVIASVSPEPDQPHPPSAAAVDPGAPAPDGPLAGRDVTEVKKKKKKKKKG